MAGLFARFRHDLWPQRRVRLAIGVGSLLLIPAILPFIGITTTYGKAQLSRAGPLVDHACEVESGTTRLRCQTAVANEIRTSTRRDDWWALGYFLLGTVAALALTSVRPRHEDRPTPGLLGAGAAALLAFGAVFDVIENARLRQSISTLLRIGEFPDRDAAIAAVGGHPDATVLFGQLKTGALAAALLLVIVSFLPMRRYRAAHPS
jgi:hypothetical protein